MPAQSFVHQDINRLKPAELKLMEYALSIDIYSPDGLKTSNGFKA